MELNENTLRTILSDQREEYQRNLGVFAEHLETKIDKLAEGHETLRQEMAEGFRDVNLDLEQIRLEMEMMRSELSIIRSDLKQKVGRDELAVLEARVAKLEQVVRSK